MPRHVVERTFPTDLSIPPADEDAKAFLDVVDGDTDTGIIWLGSYVDNRRYRTYCFYEGPDVESVRRAAGRNDLPVDRVNEVCSTLLRPASPDGARTHGWLYPQQETAIPVTVTEGGRDPVGRWAKDTSAQILRRMGIAATAVVLVTRGVVTAAGTPAAALPPPLGGQDNKGVLMWGDNREGQLGIGGGGIRLTPVQPIGLDSGVVDVAAGGHHTLAVRSTGAVVAFGSNSDGQLGNGTQTGSSVPGQVSGLTGVAKVSAGGAHSLALKSDGTVWA